MTTPAAPSGSRGAAAYVLPLYALTLFLSAFLLFEVQPMFTKMVLPLLGGSAAVWNTAVVFFQGTLLCGYFYAHLSTRLLGLRRQTLLHGVVLLLAFVSLPIGVAAGWTPPTEGLQIPWLIGLLAVSIGLPFFAVSATAPLLQKWFAHTDHPAAGDPYFLYGGSNLGSLAALVSYPFVIEPALGLHAQALAWTLGYAALVAAIATCAVILQRRFRADEASGPAPDQTGLVQELTWRLRGRWLLLSIVPSALLLGVTLHIGTNIAAVPFLWVLPLALYLLTFVLVFARRPLLSRRWVLLLQAVFVVLVASLYEESNLYLLLVLHFGALFFTAMVCHGELARRRPVATHLTEFYLWMSVGGVVGGLLAAIVAPLVFDSVYEYPLALMLGVLLRPMPEKEGRLTTAISSLTGIAQTPASKKVVSWTLDLCLPAVVFLLLARGWWQGVAQHLGGGKLLQWLLGRYSWWESALPEDFDKWFLALTLALAAVFLSRRPLRSALTFLAAMVVLAPGVLGMQVRFGAPVIGEAVRILRARSFFGVYSVDEFQKPSGRFHMLNNGAIIHGGENLDRPLGPITYYFREGPVGQFFDIVKSSPAPGRRIGVVGLGVGAAACYLTHDQRLTYYEIDPLDERIARDPRYFTFLQGAGDKVDVVIGDGRLSLAKEADGTFDVLLLTAFTGDAIPVHLLTREAFALYFKKLTEHGLLLLNVTNAYLDLMPVVSKLVEDAGLQARYSKGVHPTLTMGATEADWIVVAQKAETIARFGFVSPPWPVLEPDPAAKLWTDDFTDVVRAMRWKGLPSPEQ